MNAEQKRGDILKNGTGDWPTTARPVLTTGKLHRPAIGLIELSTEIVMQAEIRAFLPESNYGIYTSRIEFGDVADVEGLGNMEEQLTRAANLLPGSEWLDAIMYGCTSGSMVIGPEKVSELVSQSRPGVPIFNPVSAVIAGLGVMNKRRIAIVTPYVHETNRVVASFLEDHGIEIVSARTFNILSGYEMSRLTPSDLYSAALEADTEDAEAIFISCTALVVSPIVADLERATGKPVITSNQALTWQCCECVDVQRTDGHGGVLFNHRLQMP